MRPFFSFYGGKYRAAHLYPAPQYGTVYEPFAGSAGYSVRHGTVIARLSDADRYVVGVWDYLRHATPQEIEALPDLAPGQSVDNLPVPQEAKWLIGFWLNGGSAQPKKTLSSWCLRSKGEWGGSQLVWGERVRRRIVSQLDGIRLWRAARCDYRALPDAEATWFIDPPYQTPAGRYYRISTIDYADLADFCLSRRGQVIVCEQEGADWLPFRKLATIKGTDGKGRAGISREVVWTND